MIDVVGINTSRNLKELGIDQNSYPQMFYSPIDNFETVSLSYGFWPHANKVYAPSMLQSMRFLEKFGRWGYTKNMRYIYQCYHCENNPAFSVFDDPYGLIDTVCSHINFERLVK